MHERTAAGVAGISLALILMGAGCGLNTARQDRPSSSLSVEDILERCSATYSRSPTLQVRGLLRDYRGAKRKVLPIRWDYARPDRCRLQIGMDLALIVGQHWWSYDHLSGRFKAPRQITTTPIQTAAYFLSDGIPFLLPDVLTRGRRAFEAHDDRRRSRWRLEGVAWIADRPCYAIRREGQGRDRGRRWTVWIDQDRFLIRGWSWERTGPDGRMRTVLGCTYFEVVANRPMPPERFAVREPQPIVLPRKAAPGG